MTRPLRFLFVAYRWGDDLTGGAEIHHRRLGRDLLELGHDVEVWTTTGHDIEPVAHWAVQWHDGHKPGTRDENGVRVRRFPAKRTGRATLALGAKLLQRRVERWNERELDLRALLERAKWLSGLGPVHPFRGWHHPEVAGDRVERWSMKRSSLLVGITAGGGVLRIEGSAAHATAVTVGTTRFDVSGDFELKVDVSNQTETTELPIVVQKPFRPAQDHRTLGIRVRRIAWRPSNDGAEFTCDLWRDHRAIGRATGDEWPAALLRSMESLHSRWGVLFDFLRGPRSPALKRALRNPPPGFDFVVAANLPWSIVPMVAKHCPLPLIAMPLWHVEDDYYYWRHYAAALKKAKLVLANTPYAAERFYGPMGIHARFVGPGVVPPQDDGTSAEVDGSGTKEFVVLSVCRKSPEKRYDTVAEAVGRLRGEGRAVRFVLIGPDADGRPLPDHVDYRGRVGDAELGEAYRTCDAFALMSETESFGMVLAEAWMRGKPVIANRLCGPAASLVREGIDGLLAADAGELARRIAELMDDRELARRMGEAGRAKAMEEYTQRAATERLLAALHELEA